MMEQITFISSNSCSAFTLQKWADVEIDSLATLRHVHPET